jgi:hypothetical protein
MVKTPSGNATTAMSFGAIQSEEVLGYDGTIGQDGWPVDPKHPSAK